MNLFPPLISLPEAMRESQIELKVIIIRAMQLYNTFSALVIGSFLLTHTYCSAVAGEGVGITTTSAQPVSQVVFISMANTNGSYRTVYAFAREMHPKTVKTDIQYGTAGFRTK